MRASTKRILSIAMAGLLFIGTLVVYANLIEPEISAVGKIRAEVFSKEKAFKEQKQAVSKVQSLVAQLRGAAEVQETVNLALPADPNVTQILGQTHAIARSSQVDLTTFAIRPLPFQADEKSLVRRVGVLEVSLAVNGTYEAIKSFTRALETNIRISNVKTIKVAPVAAALGRNSLNASLVMEVFYQEQ